MTMHQLVVGLLGDFGALVPEILRACVRRIMCAESLNNIQHCVLEVFSHGAPVNLSFLSEAVAL